MSRSIKKGPFVAPELIKRVEEMNKTGEKKVLKTWSRSSTIFPSLVGPTQIFFNPHGGRPDGDDWHQTGERFQYLQSQGFRIFASVGTSSFSYVKPDISAVICDRLHPDGTTLRHSRSRYLQFYNAEDIMDTQVRPDLGVDW